MVVVRRMPQLDELGWEAWWYCTKHGEHLEWRRGSNPGARIQATAMGVEVLGTTLFTHESEVSVYCTVLKLAEEAISILRSRRCGNKKQTPVKESPYEGARELWRKRDGNSDRIEEC